MPNQKGGLASVAKILSSVGRDDALLSLMLHLHNNYLYMPYSRAQSNTSIHLFFHAFNCIAIALNCNRFFALVLHRKKYEIIFCYKNQIDDRKADFNLIVIK